MTAQTSQTNVFSSGMNMDMDVSMLQNGQYRYGENIRIITNDAGTTGPIQTIEGVKKYANTQISSSETIIGATTIDKYGIVITKVNDSAINKVYRIDNLDTATPSIKVILQGEFDLCNKADSQNLSVVANYETDTNIKIYFTDGASSIKVLNIVDDKYTPYSGNPTLDSNGNVMNVYALDITPGAVLPPLQITRLTNGCLSSGVVQYCYQLFNTHGTETTTSSLSNPVPLADTDTTFDSHRIEGTEPNSSSNKACEMSVTFKSSTDASYNQLNDFEKCRIIRIFYKSNNSVPIISVIDEFDLLPEQTSIVYVDNGNYSISDITIDEFNNLTSYQFIGQSLAKQNNRLFAANITEDTWNPVYDARSYRANKNGLVTLKSATGADYSFSFTDGIPSIDEKHDCINPYNDLKSPDINDTTKYAYNKDGVLGGTGINIDYEIVDTAILLSSDTTNIYPSSSIYETVKPTASAIGSLPLFSQDGKTYNSYTLPNVRRQVNYADPFIASKLRSYCRDEVYRFGIIFYNAKNVPSPVKWIGDIRFPHAAEKETGSSEYRWAPFRFANKAVGDQSSGTSSTYRCLQGRPLGIKFTVRNIPSEARAFEIVRCDRTESDRTVLMQVATSIVGLNLVNTNGDVGSTGGVLSDLRPTPYLTYAKSVFDADVYATDRRCISPDTVQSSYFTLVSPEISTGGEAYERLFDNTYFDPLYGLGSFMGASETNTKYTFYRLFAIPKQVTAFSGDNDTKVISITEERTRQGTAIAYKGTADKLLLMQKKYGTDDAPGAYIGKYYIPFFTQEFTERGGQISLLNSSYKNISIDKVRYAKALSYHPDEYDPDKFNLLPHYVQVGEASYVNWAFDMNRLVNDNGAVGTEDIRYDQDGKSNHTHGPHGPVVVANIEGLRSQVPYFRSQIISGQAGSDLATIASTLIGNVKRQVTQYGGNTYSARSNSIYISTNSYIKVGTANSYIDNVFGGDTFLGVLDYPSQMTFQYKYPKSYQHNKSFFAEYIPFETSVNVNLLHGDMVHKTANENTFDLYMQADPVQMGTYHAQDRPYFAYNGVYSSQNGSKQYVPASIYAEDKVKTTNRIYGSEPKTNNEIFDNWSSFKTANYLDVDNKFGKITNLYSFMDKLFYFQDSAVGVAAVNERSIITDNNIGALTLGTGDVLSRYDYITNSNGSSIINDKSISHSDGTLYWYDYDKNEICSYSDGVHQLSKEKYVQSYLNEMYGKKRECSLSFYDKKYREVWFKFQKKSLIYNEQVGAFTSLYTHTPDYVLHFSDKIVSIRNNQFYVINSIDTDTLDDVDKVSKIQFVVNDNYQYTKVYDNVLLSGNLIDALNAENPTVLLSAQFSTKGQNSQIFDNSTNKMDYREDTYRFAIPRENRTVDGSTDLGNMSFAGRMRGKYLLCTYTFDNTSESVFTIPQITTTYRYSLV